MSEVVEQKPETKRKAVYAMPEYMQLAEQWRQDFVVHVPEEHTVEDLLEPAYWAHVAGARAMQRFDRIEARAETGEWVADLLVVSAGRNWANVKLLATHDMTATASKATPEARHTVKLRGPHKWCVMRISDGAVIQQGLETKQAAEIAMAQYENTLATP